MLERMAGAFDLAPVGAAAQLMREFEALRETRRAERMALGKQPARGVGDHLAAIAVVAIVDEFLGAALGAEAERLIGDEFVGGETVVKLDHRDIVGADAGFLIDLARGFLRTVVTDDLNHPRLAPRPCKIGKASCWE